jgi:hypothetical protein
MKPLSQRERRLIAIAILIALVALVQLAIVGPLVAGFGERAERRAQLALIYAHNERTIASLPRLRRAAEASAAAAAPFSIVAPSAEQAGERLRERLGRTITVAGGELRSTESIAAAPPGWTRASAQAVMPYPALVVMLDRLRREPPYLVIESLNIGAERALISGKLDLLDVRVEVSIPYRASPSR